MVQIEIRDDLDRMSIRILEVLEDHGGTATTSEIKNVLGHEDTDLLNYRRRKYLAPAGLIDVYQPPSESPGPVPAQEWSLTEKGLDLLEDLEGSSEDYRDIGERVELVEDQLDAIQDTLAEIDSGANHTESDTDNPEQIMELIEAVERVESRLEEIESNPIFSKKMAIQLNSIMGFAGIVKDDYLDEMGSEELSDQIEARMEKIETFPEN
jgi:DNA-binding HxlR family transcriptional regulator